MKTFSELRTLNERKIVEKKATTYIEEGAEVYTMKKGPYTRKVDGKEADKMKRQGWKLMMRETLEEALKTTHVVIDTADGNKIVSSATNEKQAKYSVVSAERPPMNIKDKKTLKVVQLKKPVSLNKDILGTVFKESVDLEEGKMKEFHGYIDQGKSAQWIAKKMGLDMKTVKALMDDIKESTDLSEAKDDDYRRLTHAIKTTPKHRRDKVAMASQPAKTDLKAVARRKAIEKHQERMRAKKDSY